MKKKFFKLGIFFCFFSSFAANADVDGPINRFELKQDTLDEANQFFEAALHDKAASMYENIYEKMTPEDSSYLDVRYRLALSFFLSDRADRTVKLLDSSPNLNPASLYLLGLAYRKVERHTDALQLFKNLLDNDGDVKIQYEIALSYYLIGDFPTAYLYLQSLKTASDPRVSALSRLYLARIDLASNQLNQAEQVLVDLKSQLPKSDILHCELSFLLGEINFKKQMFVQAVECYQSALPQDKRWPWHSITLYRIGQSFTKIAESSTDLNEKIAHFKKAQNVFRGLVDAHPEECNVLALSECYLLQAKLLNDEEAYRQAQIILNRQDLFKSSEGRIKALLLLAKAAPTYEERDLLYQQLIQALGSDENISGESWYYKGLNDLEYVKQELAFKENSEAIEILERSVSAFELAVLDFQKRDLTRAAAALKYKIEALLLEGTPEKLRKGDQTIEQLLNPPYQGIYPQEELRYLQRIIKTYLAKIENPLDYKEAIATLEKANEEKGSENCLEKNLMLLAILYFHVEEFEKAETLFIKISENHKHSPSAAEGLYWAARCADKLKNDDKSLRYRQSLYETYSDSPLAAEAHFSCYTFQEYLQGSRTALKHLEEFTRRYPYSPFAIYAWYLIGIDYKRDRKTEEGKWLRKKDYVISIDAFQAVEETYRQLESKKLIANKQQRPLKHLYYRAHLERALANLAIAEESAGAKQLVYFEYAIETLLKLCETLRAEPLPLFASIKYESDLCLGQAYLKTQDYVQAAQVLEQTLESYQADKITRGYYLALTWRDLGRIALHNQEYDRALYCFLKAEDAAQGKILSTNEKLELWLEQSLCYKCLGQLDAAILTLSKAINHDSISSLRIKAMVHRAELYELQGRHELARRQREAVAEKGGQWAEKA